MASADFRGSYSMTFLNSVTLCGDIVGSPEFERNAQGEILRLSLALSEGGSVLPIVVNDPMIASLVAKDLARGARLFFLTGSLSDREGRICVEVRTARGHDMRAMGVTSAAESIEVASPRAGLTLVTSNGPSSETERVVEKIVPPATDAVRAPAASLPSTSRPLAGGFKLGGTSSPSPTTTAAATPRPASAPAKGGLAGLSKQRVVEAGPVDDGDASEDGVETSSAASVVDRTVSVAVPTRDARRQGVMGKLSLSDASSHTEIPF